MRNMMTYCFLCRMPISKFETVCPRCGTDYPAKHELYNYLFYGLVLLLFVIAGLLLFAGDEGTIAS